MQADLSSMTAYPYVLYTHTHRQTHVFTEDYDDVNHVLRDIWALDLQLNTYVDVLDSALHQHLEMRLLVKARGGQINSCLL